MLGMKTYTRDYVDDCRAKIDRDVKAYRKAVGASGGDFEAAFFNDMLLLLDYMFVHRLTGTEGKDGNPVNEVRVLCNSILLNRGSCRSTSCPAGRTRPAPA